MKPTPHSVPARLPFPSQPQLPHSMKNICLLLALLGLFTWCGQPELRAATANPPGKLTYQGFLTDGTGVPLGNTTPINTNVIFRIYDAATAGNLLWASVQVVTIDKGHFSVLLGEGAANGGEPFNADLTSVFTGATASDRFLQLTVGATVITPRIQFLPAPYALLAYKAMTVDTNTVLLRANIPGLDATNITTGTLAAALIPTLDGGTKITGTLGTAQIPNLDAGKITLGTLSNLRTSATSANTANAIVARDGNGDFSAGNIKLGPTAQYYAPAGEENLRIVRGMIQNSATAIRITNGGLVAGAGQTLGTGVNAGVITGPGYTVKRTEAGMYNITFIPSFTSVPVVVVSASNTGDGWLYAAASGSIHSGGCVIEVGYPTVARYDVSFSFIAIGPR